jgi:hypothetical protein
MFNTLLVKIFLLEELLDEFYYICIIILRGSSSDGSPEHSGSQAEDRFEKKLR